MNNKDLFVKVDKILLESSKPSDEIRSLIEDGHFDIEPFNLIKKLANIDQNPKYHPEGNVLNHILLVTDNASNLKQKAISPLLPWVVLFSMERD